MYRFRKWQLTRPLAQCERTAKENACCCESISRKMHQNIKWWTEYSESVQCSSLHWCPSDQPLWVSSWESDQVGEFLVLLRTIGESDGRNSPLYQSHGSASLCGWSCFWCCLKPLLHRLLQGNQLRANNRACCPHQFVQPAGLLPRGISGPARHSQGDGSQVCPPVLD